MTSAKNFDAFSLVVTRGLLVITRGHSWSLVCTFRHDHENNQKRLVWRKSKQPIFVGSRIYYWRAQLSVQFFGMITHFKQKQTS